MKYISTRGGCPPISFKKCLLDGLAPDGGLYVPESWPHFSFSNINEMKSLSYEELTKKILQPFIENSFSEEELDLMIFKAYLNFNVKDKCLLKKINDGQYLLELFHGPTLAFKDFALQLIAQMFELILSKSKSKINIIGATSGDTGSAAVEAFKEKENVNLFILFPKGRISDIQRRQMSTINAKNIFAIMIDGDFDDCQNIVKSIFEDLSFKEKMKISGVNSINWARILAQVVYYFFSFNRLPSNVKGVSYCIPSGNFGNIFAGYIAKKIGLPIHHLIAATNKNDILDRVIQTGIYKREKVFKTISPSMDIQVSSNFERLIFELYNRDSNIINNLMIDFKNKGKFTIEGLFLHDLKEKFWSGSSNEKETKLILKDTLIKFQELVCPHTAVGLKVSNDYLKAKNSKCNVITLATAHPAKFPDAVLRATNVKPKLPERLKSIMLEEEKYFAMSNSIDDIKSFIKERG